MILLIINIMWFIRGINFLEKIPIEELEQILKGAITFSIEKDKYVKPRSDSMDKIWLLKTGTVKLIKKADAIKEIVLTTLEQGEILGFYPENRKTIELLFSPTGVLFYLFQTESIEEKFRKLPSEIFKVNVNLNGRIIEYTPQLSHMFHQKYTDRIIEGLRLLANAVGERKKVGIIIKGKGIIELIEKLSLLSAQVVILILSEMWKSGLIEIYKDRLVIKNESIIR